MLQHAASERDPFGEADEPGPGPRRRGARGLRPGGLVADDFDEQAGPAVGCDGDGDGGAGRVLARVGQPVGADNAVTSCDLRVLVDQAAEPVASSDADVVAGGREMGPAVGWLLAEGPVRPVGVVVIDVFAEDVAQMSPAGDEDAVGALAPRGGDPPLADRVRAWRLDGRGDDPHAGRGEDGVERAGVGARQQGQPAAQPQEDQVNQAEGHES